MTGVVVPVATLIGAVPVTPVTVPEPLPLKVFQSVLVKYPETVVVAAGIEITGAVPPLDATGLVAVTPVTVPEPVPAPIAVLNVAASKAETVLSAFILGNVIAVGFVSVKKLPPTVVAPNDVRPVAATNPVAPPSHLRRSVKAVSQFVWLAVVGIA